MERYSDTLGTAEAQALVDGVQQDDIDELVRRHSDSGSEWLQIDPDTALYDAVQYDRIHHRIDVLVAIRQLEQAWPRKDYVLIARRWFGLPYVLTVQPYDRLIAGADTVEEAS